MSKKNRYQKRDHGDEKVFVEGNAVTNSQMTNQSFLELIRPMIMDQLAGLVKGFFKEQETQIQKTVKKFLHSQQFKTV